MNQPGRPSRTGITGMPKATASDLHSSAENTPYIAYTGEFHVDEEKKTLTHSMFISLFPNWIGQTQPRIVNLEGDELHLSSASPIHSGGKTVMSYLKWKRAKKN